MRRITLVFLFVFLVFGCSAESDRNPVMIVTVSGTPIDIRTSDMRAVLLMNDHLGIHITVRTYENVTVALASKTSENVGAYLRIRICGIEISQFLIEEPITNGTFSFPISRYEDAATLVRTLRGEAECGT